MLFETLKKDRLKYFKTRTESAESRIAYEVLGVLISDASKDEKQPSDEVVLKHITKFVKNAQICRDAAQESLKRSTAEAEIVLLTKYLPNLLVPSEILSILEPFRGQGISKLKDVMAHFKIHYAGRYSGAEVSALARELLN